MRRALSLSPPCFRPRTRLWMTPNSRCRRITRRSSRLPPHRIHRRQHRRMARPWRARPNPSRSFQTRRSGLYWGMPRNIVLASSSPRRRDLLVQHGFTVEVMPSHAPEMMPDFLTVAETTLLNARIKAAQIVRARPDALVLAADTLVALDG